MNYRTDAEIINELRGELRRACKRFEDARLAKRRAIWIAIFMTWAFLCLLFLVIVRTLWLDMQNDHCERLTAELKEKEMKSCGR